MEKTVPDMEIDEGSEEASDKSSDAMETENSLNFSQSNEVIFLHVLHFPNNNLRIWL